MAKLRVIKGSLAGTVLELTGEPAIVGRLPTCDLVLPEITVSRRHARILRKEDTYYVEDLGSHHGTLVNGTPVEGPRPLADKDEIRLSRVLLKFSEHDSAVLVDDENSSIVYARELLTDGGGEEEETQRRLRALLRITSSLGGSLDLQEIFPRVMEGVFRIFPQAECGYVLTAEPDGELIPQAGRHCDVNSDDRPVISRTVAERVLSDGQAVVSRNAARDFVGSESIFGLRIRSVLCAPMMGASGSPLGMIYLASRDVEQTFSSEDLDLLINVANLAGQAIEHARLSATQLRFAQREHDLVTAQQVQKHFLPQQPPQVPGYELQHDYRAADAVGGDYFGYQQLPDGRWAVAIGDVAGKGVSAALLMARLCGETRYALVTRNDPAAAVGWLNRQLVGAVTTGRFITFALVVLDPQGNEVELVNAGHLPALLRRADGQIERLGKRVGGPPLAVRPDQVYESERCPFQPGDTLLLYTDGVSEARNADGEHLGHEAIQELLAEGSGAARAVERLREAVERHSQSVPQSDDICIVAISRTPT